MIADLDETLRQLIIAELPIKNGEIEVSFDQPKREWSSRLTKPTVNLFLYDLRENPVLRQTGMEQIVNGRLPNNIAHLKRTPLRVDCFYMLTTWAAEPEDEHRLMTRAMLALFRFPVLPEDRLIGGVRHQPFEIPARIAIHDRLTNPAEVWASLDNEMRPTVPYLVTLALDPWTEVTGPVVRTLIFRAGQSYSLPRQTRLGEIETEMVFIGGTVRSKTASHNPLAGIDVAIKGTGIFDRSDEQGHFTLGSMPTGEYVLVAWPAEGKPSEKKIAVPARDGDYDLEL